MFHSALCHFFSNGRSFPIYRLSRGISFKQHYGKMKLKLHPSESLKVKFQTLRSQVKRAIRESRGKFFESANIEFKINPKRLWSVLKTRSKSCNIPQSVSMATGNLRATADTSEEIADIFNNYFTLVFSVPQEDIRRREIPCRRTPL